MKIMVSGKGGCGKSTISVLLAKAFARNDYQVLLVDADESNLGISRLLGVDESIDLMTDMGGRQGVKTKLWSPDNQPSDSELFAPKMTIDDLPSECIAEVNGVKLLVVGKIRNFGEGCGCLMGALSKTVLSRLDEGERAVVVIDAEAGIEHFGRKVDASCDLVLGVIDPTYESFLLSTQMEQMAAAAGLTIRFILNKMDSKLKPIVYRHIRPEQVVAEILNDVTLFNDSLHGRPISFVPDEINGVIDFVKKYRKPATLGVL